MQSIIGKLCSNLHQICCLRHHQMAQGQNWTESVLTKMSFCTLHRTTHQIKNCTISAFISFNSSQKLSKITDFKTILFLFDWKKKFKFSRANLGGKIGIQNKTSVPRFTTGLCGGAGVVPAVECVQ